MKSSFSPVRIISGTGELLGHQDSQNCCGFAAVPRRQGALHVDPGVMTWCHFRRGFPLALLEKGGWEDLPEASWGFDGTYFRFLTPPVVTSCRTRCRMCLTSLGGISIRCAPRQRWLPYSRVRCVSCCLLPWYFKGRLSGGGSAIQRINVLLRLEGLFQGVLEEERSLKRGSPQSGDKLGVT